MCDEMGRVAADPALPESNRRQFLEVLATTAAARGLVAAGAGSASAAPGRPAGRGGARSRLVLLGTAGGPGILDGSR
ncbi:hypothetical protein ACI79C_22615 [Geodermatophilus sp. SYSU D00697]